MSLKRHLVQRYFLRFHMGLMFSAATFAGVGTSKLLLYEGVHQVLWRYPMAVVVSYLVFLGLIRVWLAYVLSSATGGTGNTALDVLNIDVPIPGGRSSGGSGFSGFGGGRAGGGGATDSWASAAEVRPLSSSGSSSSGSSWGDSFDLDGDFMIIVVLIALVGAIIGSGGYLIYVAPQILPDLAVNAFLASYVARAAKRAEADGWVAGALKSTWIPFAGVLTLATALAYAIHSYCPAAGRLLEALNCPGG